MQSGTNIEKSLLGLYTKVLVKMPVKPFFKNPSKDRVKLRYFGICKVEQYYESLEKAFKLDKKQDVV